jgi:hypothetical protein
MAVENCQRVIPRTVITRTHGSNGDLVATACEHAAYTRQEYSNEYPTERPDDADALSTMTDVEFEEQWGNYRCKSVRSPI